MHKIIKMKLLLIGLLSGLAFNNVWALSKPVVEGTDYTIISGVPVTNEPKGVVNVKEFFAFTCVHCRDIEPMLQKTLLPNKKIDFDKIHVAWDSNSMNFAKLSITIKLMNLNKLYVPAFNAFFDRRDLTNPAELKTFLAQNGLSKDQVDKFLATYNSFTANSKAAEAKKLTEAYNITATPTFIVADKYQVMPAVPERLLEVVQELVKKATADSK